jgi:hypothetical protein
MMTTHMRRLAAVLVLGGLLAGCGGGGDDDDDGVASVDESAAADESTEDEDGDGAGGGSVDETEMQDAALEYAQCMRDHGIDMPDPQSSADGRGVLIGGPAGGKAKFNPNTPAFKTAEKACKKYMDAVRPNLTPAQQQEMQQQMLEMVRCMREHGVNIPDAAAGGEGVRIGPGTGVDPESPTFQRAQKACMKGGKGGFSIQREAKP